MRKRPIHFEGTVIASCQARKFPTNRPHPYIDIRQRLGPGQGGEIDVAAGENHAQLRGAAIGAFGQIQ